MKESKLIPNFFQAGGYAPVQATNSQFIPTYAGVPLAEGEKYGTGITEAYHKNIADMTRLDIMNANRKVTKGDETASEAYTKSLQESMQGMAKAGDYENMTMRVNAMARDFVNNKDLKAMAESRANADKDLEDRRQLALKGINPWFTKDIDAHQTVKTDEKGNKIYNIYQSTTETPREHEKKRAEIWQPLTPNAGALSKEAVAKLKLEIPGYFTTGTWKGISGSDKNGVETGRIAQLIDHAMKQYESSAEYRQEKRHDIEELVAQGYSEEEAGVKAEELARRRMFSSGMLKTFSQVDPNFLVDYKYRHDLASGDTTTPPTVETEKLPAMAPNTAQLDFSELDPAAALNPSAWGQTKQGLKTAWNYVKKANADLAVSITPEEEQAAYESYAGRVGHALSWAEKGRARKELLDQKKADYIKSVDVGSGPSQQLRDEYVKSIEAGAKIFGNPDNPEQPVQNPASLVGTQAGHQYAQQYADLVNNRMDFPAYKSYASINDNGATKIKEDKQLRNDFLARQYYNLDTGEPIEVFAPKSGGKASEEIMGMVNNTDVNIEAVGALAPYNPLGVITGNKRMANGQVVRFTNPKDGSMVLAVATKPDSYYASPAGKQSFIASEVWSALALKPGQQVEHVVNLEGYKIPVRAESIPTPGAPDSGSDKIKVYRIGKMYYPEGKILEGGYDELMAKIFAEPFVADNN